MIIFMVLGKASFACMAIPCVFFLVSRVLVFLFTNVFARVRRGRRGVCLRQGMEKGATGTVVGTLVSAASIATRRFRKRGGHPFLVA